MKNEEKQEVSQIVLQHFMNLQECNDLEKEQLQMISICKSMFEQYINEKSDQVKKINLERCLENYNKFIQVCGQASIKIINESSPESPDDASEQILLNAKQAFQNEKEKEEEKKGNLQQIQQQQDQLLNPQSGILFPLQKHSGFVCVKFRTQELFQMKNILTLIKQKISAIPVYQNPPYIFQEGSESESILQFSERLKQKYENEFSTSFGVSTRLFKYFFDQPQPKLMTEFRELQSIDKQHRFPDTQDDLIFYIKSKKLQPIQEMISYIKTKLETFDTEFYEVISDIKERNNFGYFDGGSNPKRTCNPTNDNGPIIDSFPKDWENKQPYKTDEYDQSIKDKFDTQTLQKSLDQKQQQFVCSHASNSNLVDIGIFETTFIKEEPHKNGSFGLFQVYHHHKIQEFFQLPDEQQDQVFGRKKKDGSLLVSRNPLSGQFNEEYPRSHIVRTHVVMTDTKNQTADVDPLLQNPPYRSLAPLQINRQASIFEDQNKNQFLAFMAFAPNTQRFDQILERMIGLNVTYPGSEQVVDSLLLYTKAIRGQYFYFPNLEEVKQLTCTQQPTQNKFYKKQQQYDAVIVGGGPAGIYTAYKLRQNNKNWSIAIYERNNDLGGRIVSVIPPGKYQKIEIGAMRYASDQIRVCEEVQNFGLTSVDFPVDGEESQNNPICLRGQNLLLKDLKNYELMCQIYSFKDKLNEEQFNQGIYVSIIKKYVPSFKTPVDKEELQVVKETLSKILVDSQGEVTLNVDEGIKLKDISIHVLIEILFGQEAFQFLKDTSGYYTPWGEWNAYDAIVDNLSDFLPKKFYKIKEGYNELFQRMAQDFKKSNYSDIFTNEILSKFDYSKEDGLFRLDFISNIKVQCKHLVLAMPKAGLQNIYSPLFEKNNVKKLIKSVSGKPLYKAYLCYESSWWNPEKETDSKQTTQTQSEVGHLVGRSVSDLNIQQVYYWDEGGILIYNDGQNPDYFTSFTGQKETPVNNLEWQSYQAPKHLRLELHRQFFELVKDRIKLTIDQVPKPYDAAFISWDEDSISGGIDFWRVCSDSQDVIKKIVKPILNLNLYITSDSWSNEQGWVEGAFQSAEQVVYKILNQNI